MMVLQFAFRFRTCTSTTKLLFTDPRATHFVEETEVGIKKTSSVNCHHQTMSTSQMRQCPPTLLPWRQSIAGASERKGTYKVFLFFSQRWKEEFFELFSSETSKIRIMGQYRDIQKMVNVCYKFWRVCSMYTSLEALLYDGFMFSTPFLGSESWTNTGCCCSRDAFVLSQPDFPHSKDRCHYNTPVAGTKNRLKLKHIKHTSSMASFDSKAVTNRVLTSSCPPFFMSEAEGLWPEDWKCKYFQGNKVGTQHIRWILDRHIIPYHWVLKTSKTTSFGSHKNPRCHSSEIGSFLFTMPTCRDLQVTNWHTHKLISLNREKRSDSEAKLQEEFQCLHHLGPVKRDVENPRCWWEAYTVGINCYPLQSRICIIIQFYPYECYAAGILEPAIIFTPLFHTHYEFIHSPLIHQPWGNCLIANTLRNNQQKLIQRPMVFHGAFKIKIQPCRQGWVCTQILCSHTYRRAPNTPSPF